MKALMLTLAACVGLALTGCGGGGSSPDSTAAGTTANQPGPTVELPGGRPPTTLVVKDLKKGSGAEAKPGDKVTLQYVGVHWDGEPYSNSWTYREAPTFGLHEHRLGPGLDRAIPGMRVGGRREVIVPPRLVFYPDEPQSKVHLPPRETVVFLVDLLGVH